MGITVYSQNNCQPCKATERWLNNKSILFNSVSLDDNEELRGKLIGRGFMSTPVVIITGADGSEIGAWSGFQPTRLNALADMAFEMII